MREWGVVTEGMHVHAITNPRSTSESDRDRERDRERERFSNTESET